MFDKSKFAQIIKNIKETYNSQEEFSKKSGIGRTYLSQYMNMRLDEPPLPRMLEKLAKASHGITTYKDLMKICGYTEKTLENKAYSIYATIKEYYKNFTNSENIQDISYELNVTIERFQNYIYKLSESLASVFNEKIFLRDEFNLATIIEDYKYVGGFLLLYNEFLMLLKNEDYIDIKNYVFIDYSNIENIYDNLHNFENLELFSLCSEDITLKNRDNELNNIIEYIDSFSRYLSLSLLSDFDSNSLTELFKEKVKGYRATITNRLSDGYKKKVFSNCGDQFYMCPVYGRIAAGQPNWAEECIEGRIPIDPVLMDIINPEECYFLKVNGESMNKVIRNGAYALIRKTDWVKNGEIAVVLVNGYDATLKKFTKQGDLVILEPMSDDPSFETQVYDKNTEIRIIGKYIGKFETN